MIRRIANATRLVLLVQARGYFPHAFGLFVLMVVGAILFVLPESIGNLILPVFLVSEPGMLGVMAVAAHRYLEVGNLSIAALRVSPLQSGEYLFALVLGSALLATVAGGITFAAIEGIGSRLAWILVFLFVFAVMSGLLGFALSLRYADFPRFIMATVPAVAFWQAPLLATFGIVPLGAIIWIPSAPGILALVELCKGTPQTASMVSWLILSTFLTSVAFVLVLGQYRRHLLSSRELT